jgi:DNA-binding NarL/FixJ family response regulator
MRILIVDDHALFLEGMVNLLKLKGFEVAGTAGDGVEALAKARHLNPDVILMDINMAGCNGLDATRLIKTELPQVKIIMLTMSQDEKDLYEAFASGATGYLLKSLDSEEFIRQLRKAAAGEIPLAPQMTRKILAGFLQNKSKTATVGGRPKEQAPALTKRQLEILTLAAQGMTYREIGDVLGLTEVTIKYHMGEIADRLKVRNRSEILLYALKTGLIATRDKVE